MSIIINLLKLILLPMLVLTLASSSLALDQNVKTRRVKFQRGRSDTVVGEAIARGEVVNYYIGAARGQTMTLHIESSESNAVFTVSYAENGTVLPDGEEVQDWEGTLPSAGDYIVSVGSTRGGSDFSLFITIE